MIELALHLCAARGHLGAKQTYNINIQMNRQGVIEFTRVGSLPLAQLQNVFPNMGSSPGLVVSAHLGRYVLRVLLAQIVLDSYTSGSVKELR